MDICFVLSSFPLIKRPGSHPGRLEQSRSSLLFSLSKNRVREGFVTTYQAVPSRSMLKTFLMANTLYCRHIMKCGSNDLTPQSFIRVVKHGIRHMLSRSFREITDVQTHWIPLPPLSCSTNPICRGYCRKMEGTFWGAFNLNCRAVW